VIASQVLGAAAVGAPGLRRDRFPCSSLVCSAVAARGCSAAAFAVAAVRGASRAAEATLRTVIGAADKVDEYRPGLRAAADKLGSHYFNVRPNEGDLFATVVFEVPDEAHQQSATGDELLGEIKQIMPTELHNRILLAIRNWPDETDS
jgi:hypothetical protein